MNQVQFNIQDRFRIFSILFIASAVAAVYLRLDYFYFIPFAALTAYAGWEQPRLALYMLLLSLPVSIELGITNELSLDFPDEPLMILCASLCMFALLHNPALFTRGMGTHPLLVVLILSLTWIIVPILASEHKVYSIKFIAAKLWYLAAFVFAPHFFLTDKRSILRAIKLISYSLLAIVVISLVRHAASGFTFQQVNSSVVPFFRNHVNYSAMLVCFIPVFITFYLHAKNKSLRIILMSCVFLLLAALFFSYARGAWLALFTGICAWWLIKRKLLLKAYIASVIIAFGLFFWIQQEKKYLQYAHDFNSTIYHENFSEHLRATYQLKDVSTAERFYRWIAGVRMIDEKPLTGFGPGTFYHHYKGYAVPAFKTWVSRNEERSTVHNYYLLITIEQGVPGLLIFLVLCGMLLYYSQNLYHKMTDRFYRAVSINCGIIIVMIMTVNFMSDLIETDKVGSIFFLCLSFLTMIDLRRRNIGGRL